MTNPDVTTLNDALVELVKALGGSKVVGVKLWPAKGVEAAQRHLLACLNPERQEKLALEEVVHIMRLGREDGQHSAMVWICQELGYSIPSPLSREDEVDRLQRDFIAATRSLAMVAARIQSLQGSKA